MQTKYWNIITLYVFEIVMSHTNEQYISEEISQWRRRGREGERRDEKEDNGVEEEEEKKEEKEEEEKEDSEVEEEEEEKEKTLIC